MAEIPAEHQDPSWVQADQARRTIRLPPDPEPGGGLQRHQDGQGHVDDRPPWLLHEGGHVAGGLVHVLGLVTVLGRRLRLVVGDIREALDGVYVLEGVCTCLSSFALPIDVVMRPYLERWALTRLCKGARGSWRGVQRAQGWRAQGRRSHT